MTNEVKNVPELRFPGFEGEWGSSELGNIAENYIGGGTPSTKVKEYWNGNIPWIQSSDLKIDDVKHMEFHKYINSLAIENSSAKLIPKNSIAIVTRVGVGKLALIREEFSTSQDFLSLSNLSLDINYALYALYKLIRKESTKLQGTSIKGLTKNDLLSKHIKIPSYINEQEQIGDFFSKLDRQIELEEQKLEKLEEQKKGYMQKIFSQELRFKDENGNKYPEWEEKEINSVLEKIIDNRGKTPENNATEIYPMLEVNSLGNYYPKYNNVAKFVSEKTYKTWFREHIKLNDVLFSTVGNTGLVSLMDNNKAVIAQNIVGLRINSENDATFLYYLLSYWENQKKVKQIQMGAVQPSVKVSQFKYLKFYFPTKDEQQEIGVFLTIFDKIFEKQSKKIEILKERKQGLLQKMFV